MHFGYAHYDQDPVGFYRDVLGVSTPAAAPIIGGGDMNLTNWFTDTGGWGAIVPEFQIPIGVGREVGEVFGEVFGQQPSELPAGQVPGGIPQYSTGAQGSRSLCWQPSDDPDTIRRRYARRRVKMVRVPDNSPQRWHWELREYCAPRRMNYCNPRALGRAARRLGGFQQMAAGVEKIISRALRRKGRRSAGSSPSSKSCFPRKRGC